MPYFCGGNPVALRLKCIRAHKTLFSPNFHYENTAMEVPYFHGKTPVEFRVWCAMAHWQGFMPTYTVRASMFGLGQARALQSIKHIEETNVTW